jgi:hypothetical protein
MNKLTEFTPSSALLDYVHEVCPIDAHMYITMQGVWGVGCDGFSNQFYSTTTTRCTVVRAFSCKGVTYWTRENWTHDNGYQCTLDILTKVEFLQAIHS